MIQTTPVALLLIKQSNIAQKKFLVQQKKLLLMILRLHQKEQLKSRSKLLFNR